MFIFSIGNDRFLDSSNSFSGINVHYPAPQESGLLFEAMKYLGKFKNAYLRVCSLRRVLSTVERIEWSSYKPTFDHMDEILAPFS